MMSHQFLLLRLREIGMIQWMLYGKYTHFPYSVLTCSDQLV